MTDRSALPSRRGEDEQLDVDTVHTALQEFQQELREAQRDRVYLNFLMTENRFINLNLLLFVTF